jgi:uncharacterized Zn-binding protein involved in type VI secretion
MTIIEPVVITDSMIGSGAGTVPEVEYPEWWGQIVYNKATKVMVKASPGTFYDLSAGPAVWNGLAAAPNGDVYGCENGHSIWKQAGGSGVFVDQNPSVGDKDWSGLAAAPNGDIYACVYNGGICKQTGGTGDFVDLNPYAGTLFWNGIAAAPNGDIYACVLAGSIWKQTLGTGYFADLTAGTKDWGGVAAAPNGDVYACVFGGSIWKQTGGAGSFVDLSTGNKYWTGMAAAPNGDVYGCVNGGSIWKQTGGSGAFVDQVAGDKGWNCMTVACGDNAFGVYAGVATGSIWVSVFETIHNVYESLVNTNLANYPPISVNQTTPKWLEYSATNKWMVFDGKVNSQMATPSPAVYVITPGAAFNSVVLLNLEATSVVIATDAPAYSQTVSTGATDIVKMDLAGGAASVLTITINNTAGAAKCGEIIIGNSYSLGTMQPFPTVGVTDYSTKEVDVFGNWNIVPRSSSEKMSCVISVPYASLDAVIAKLKLYRATPIAFIGSASYACTIIYGFIKDWSVPVSTRGKSILALEIDGLT